MFNDLFKSVILLMVASNKTVIDSLLKIDPYYNYLPNRDLPLSIIQNDKIDPENYQYAYQKLIELLRDARYDRDYNYLRDLNNLIDDIVPFETQEKYPEKYYYLKVAIVVRIYEALKRIKPKSGLDLYREDLIKFNNFKNDRMISSLYNSVCNIELQKAKLTKIDGFDFESNKIDDYLTKIDLDELKSYVSYFFYWFKNDRFKN